jgi:hypothetical protein
MKALGSVSAGLAMGVLVLSSCSEAFVVPTTRGECHGASADAEDSGSSEGSSGLVLAYADVDHALGAAGTLYVCLPHEGAATLSTDAPESVEVDPGPLIVPGDGAVPELSVTVAHADADGDRVAIGYDDGDLGATVFVEIEVDGDEWSFRGP